MVEWKVVQKVAQMDDSMAGMKALQWVEKRVLRIVARKADC